jgi:alkanesulfonate monooxygenase SsuD/methylene tetrahydromethanopterin reductase-like flavin-dependent oxidoreductase (luciferase family)
VPYRGYDLKELSLVPRPLRLPVECWQPIQGGTGRAMDFMAKHGIQGLVGGGSAEGGAMHNVVLAWQEAHKKIGLDLELGERLAFGFHFFLADSREEGIRLAGKYYEENMKMFGELRLVRALSDEQLEIMRDPKRAPSAKLPRIEDAIAAGGVLCGSPAQIVDHLKMIEQRYPGLERVSVSLSVGVPKAACLEQLQRFAEEVMPAFSSTKPERAIAAK